MGIAAVRNDTDLGATRRHANFAAGLTYGDLDDPVRHAAKRHILDSLGACLAGSGQSVTEAAEAVLAEGLAEGPVPVPGRGRRADAATAAYLAGASAHGLELDDGYRAGSVHPGCVVVPAALAAGYGRGASGLALLTAVAADYEVAARIAEAAQPNLRRRGLHAERRRTPGRRAESPGRRGVEREVSRSRWPGNRHGAGARNPGPAMAAGRTGFRGAALRCAGELNI